MRKVPLLAIVVVGAVLLASCRSSPIYNVERSTFNTTEQPSVEQVTQAIQRAGTSLGWQMEVERPGLILGTLNIRSHQAVVEIPYDTQGFAIQYQDSTNLNYDGESIHTNYNGWIQNLERRIRTEVSTL